MLQLQFPDKVVNYDRFVNDIAARLATILKKQEAEQIPPYISQRKAFEMFGQGNVLRWRSKGKIEPRKRPGKVEYETARLIELQNTVQDYFD